ncbi:von Willebrand factor type A [Methanolobus psychrophilus R15]|nr:von Willebrand factor type A [Methanolobus psychrophilus R15]
MGKDTGTLDHLTEEEISELISSHFPKLDSTDILRLTGGFEAFEKHELEAILTPGARVLKRGLRVLMAYLKASPGVYRLLAEEDFYKWLLIAQKVSVLSVSCCEGFFDSSAGVISRGDLPLLERWADKGISYAEKSKWLAIAYFKYTGVVVGSTDFDNFKQLVTIGRDFADSNVNVAEEYFKNLPLLQTLLSAQDFVLWCGIIERILKIYWLAAVDIINATPGVLSDVPVHRRRIVLEELDAFIVHGGTAILALFRNAPYAIGKLDDRNMHRWASIASEISKRDTEASVSFMNWSPEILSYLEMDEIEDWVNKGIDTLSDKHAFRAYVYGSFKGMGRNSDHLGWDERSLLLDTGAKLALVNPECLEKYFENAPDAFKMLEKENFGEWVSIGIAISEQSSTYGSSYFKNSVSSLRIIAPSYHGDIFRTSRNLLEKDWLLAGAFFDNLPQVIEKIGVEDIRRWAGTGIRVYEHTQKLAVDYFSHSPMLMKDLGVCELEEWALNGIKIMDDNPLLGRPYFSLRSKSSRDFIEELTGSVALQKVAAILRYYALGLSGVNFSILSRKVLQLEEDADTINPVVAGRTIYLAPRIKKYRGFDDNFRIYKLSVMHEVGHVQFSSMEIPSRESSGLIEAIMEKYGREKDGTYMDQVHLEKVRDSSDTVDISDIVALFPNEPLAASILGVLEDARVEYMIMDSYRGVRSDLENIRHQMLMERPVPEDGLEKFMEALLWLSTGHEPAFALTGTTAEMTENVRNSLDKNILRQDSSILDCLEVTFDIYKILDNQFGPLGAREYEILKNIEYRGMGLGAYGNKEPLSSRAYENVIKRFIPESETDLTAEKERPKEEKVKSKSSYAKDKDWKILGSYRYDEWDTSISDYKTDWCTVKEVEPVGVSADYYRDASERYRNEIALIKRVFSRMRPEAFHRMRKQVDGTEIDIDAFLEALIDKKGGINPEDRLYIRWDKHERDVATLFLVDVSASTRKVLGMDGRSIVDVEKDALIVMIQALESIGDKYAIYAFSGNTREDVEYFVIKEFEEELSGDVARRISLLEPVANTRLGPAIRHSITKLEQVNARTKIMMLLSDGEPYDTCTGEGAYQGQLAEEDTRIAIQEVRSREMHFFCITVDNNPGEYLDNIFSDVGYTIIDDARVLPESLPLLYKRITT